MILRCIYGKFGFTALTQAPSLQHVVSDTLPEPLLTREAKANCIPEPSHPPLLLEEGQVASASGHPQWVGA